MTTECTLNAGAAAAQAHWTPARKTIGDRVSEALLLPRDWSLRAAALSYPTFIHGLASLSPAYIERESRARARRALLRAVRRVPAYAQFLARHSTPADPVPETTKKNYIQSFPIESRCIDGRIPYTRVAIDESSGSTGTPFNWVRGDAERHHVHLLISYFSNYCFGRRPRITLNAFSMGAWATGVNMGLAMQGNSIVKNTGPDVAKILATLREFGPGLDYLVTGYPPFLKLLLDTARSEGFALQDYRLDALVGGEGMSEGLRDYLQRNFRNVFSGYGATDLEIAIAGETPLSVAIRRLARHDPAVRSALFGEDSRLPMVFQYNALTHHIEVNVQGDLLVTITRGDMLSPRIRYNVGDQGGVARYDHMAQKLAAMDIDLADFVGNADEPRLRLPFVWVHGRRDYTVSMMGANIYPEDLEQCLYADPALAELTRSFCLGLSDAQDGTTRPCFAFEIDAEPTADLQDRFATSITSRLHELNADYRAAFDEYPEAMTPEIQLHRLGAGPFAADRDRIKQTRVFRQSRAAHDASDA